MAKPDWHDLPPDQWPPEARTVFTILANIAQRRMAREAAQKGEETAPKTTDAA